jgi:glutamyl-tRNA synthetase
LALEAIDQKEKFAWRWRFSPGKIAWQDAIQGTMTASPLQQLGDFVIARGDGTPAYQLAVVVDDHDMGVTEVVRGADLLCSTYRQLAILQHLGWSIPNYYHVPLMVGPDGRRLAKRHGDTRLSHFRQLGMSAEQVVGYLAWTLGLQPEPLAVPARELIGKLDWQLLPKHPTTVSPGEPQIHF